MRKSILVLILIFYGRNGPWLESLVKLHVWSLKFARLAENTLGIEKNAKIILGLFILGRFSPFENFGKVTNQAPQKLRVYKCGPCDTF